MHATRQQCDVDVRWMLRRDLDAVLEIEKASFEFAWSHDDFISALKQRNCIGMVAERDEMIVGYMVYELLQSRVRITNFAVAPHARLLGVGTAMVDKLIGKLSHQRRDQIVCEVRETNLGAQLFFRKSGFLAIDTMAGHYEDTEEDAYVFSFLMGGE